MAKSAMQSRVREVEMLFSARRYREVVAKVEPMLRSFVPPSARYMHGASLLRLGKPGAAKASLLAAEPAMPGHTALRYDLAQCLLSLGDFGGGLARLDAVLQAEPGHALAIGAKAETLQLLGRHGEAAELLAEARAGGNDEPALIVAQAKLAPGHHDAEAAIRELRPIAEGAVRAGMNERVTACFRLAGLLDRKGEFEGAFEAASLGNRLAGGSFDPEAYGRSVDAMISAWTPEAIQALPRGSDATEKPVFIVGVPRSGTSLVEQILASHPEVHGGGELELMNPLVRAMVAEGGSGRPMVTDLGRVTGAGLERLAAGYLEQLTALDPGASRITDKMPMNLHHVGLIRQAFPGARVIFCRRDPRDVAISCYFQQFAHSHPYAGRLDWMGSFIRQSRRLWEHWRGVLGRVEPAMPMLEVVYEDLVADQEGQSRRMVEFLGLGWDEGCLRFHESERVTRTASNEQVRRPMYRSSVGRWRAYESHLSPLLGSLGGLDGGAS